MNRAKQVLDQFCVECHNNHLAEARINLQRMASIEDFGHTFKDWKKVIRMLRERKMPPPELPQPNNAERAVTIRALHNGLEKFIRTNAGDPGHVVMRRLTSAEYAYTIEDLTGLPLPVGSSFVSDAVGGEGFTNVDGAAKSH